MEKKTKIISTAIGILSLLVTSGIKAQQDPMYTQYMFNTQSVNPAYAGTSGVMNATALVRAQWFGIDGAPRTQTLSLNTPLPRENMGLGMSIVNDKIGPINQTLFFADYSYTIRVTDNSKLAFGLKAGFNLIQGNLVNLKTGEVNDDAFSANIDSKLTPNFGFGMYYFSNKWYLGASTPKLLENKIEDGQVYTEAEEKRHYFFIAGYIKEINKNIIFKPTILTKMNVGSPISLDISANFMFEEIFWTGLAYRLNESIGLILKYQIDDQLSVGYAYDFNISKLSKYNSGSHEIMVSYDFLFNRTKIKSPRYF